MTPDGRRMTAHENGRADAVNVVPGLVSSSKEEPLTAADSTVTTFHGDTFPGQCCPNCDSRRQEAVALRARASLLRDAIRRSDPRTVVEWHALELLAMLEARGMA